MMKIHMATEEKDLYLPILVMDFMMKEEIIIIQINNNMQTVKEEVLLNGKIK